MQKGLLKNIEKMIRERYLTFFLLYVQIYSTNEFSFNQMPWVQKGRKSPLLRTLIQKKKRPAKYLIIREEDIYKG